MQNKFQQLRSVTIIIAYRILRFKLVIIKNFAEIRNTNTCKRVAKYSN